MVVRVGLLRKLSDEELMLLKCGVGEDSLSPLDCKEIQPVHPKGAQSWVFIGSGLPKRNGMRHAAEIANMSLDILTPS